MAHYLVGCTGTNPPGGFALRIVTEAPHPYPVKRTVPSVHWHGIHTSFPVKRGLIGEQRLLGELRGGHRVIARVAPEHVVAAAEDFDRRIEEARALLVHLYAEKQAVLDAAVAECGTISADAIVPAASASQVAS